MALDRSYYTKGMFLHGGVAGEVTPAKPSPTASFEQTLQRSAEQLEQLRPLVAELEERIVKAGGKIPKPESFEEHKRKLIERLRFCGYFDTW